MTSSVNGTNCRTVGQELSWPPRVSGRLTFQPFVVNCLTCGSALRVTDPGIVGTIASCPKCESMVPIDLPSIVTKTTPPQVAVGQSSIDSEAITEDAIAPEGFAADQLGHSDDVADSSVPRPPSPFLGQVPPQNEAAGAIPTSQVWQSQRTTRSQQIALIATLSMTGLLAAGAIFGWFVSIWQDRSDSGSVAAASIDSKIDPKSEQTDAVENDMRDQQAADPEVTTTPQPADPNPLTEAKANPVSSNSLADQSPDLVEEEDALIPTDLIPSSPLDEQPADSTPERELQPRDRDAADGAAKVGATELPPEFAKYTQILPKEGSLDKPSIDAPPTIDDIELEDAATDDEFELSETKPRVLNLRRDLGTRMAVSSKSYPLADLLLLIGQVTTVPMEIDWVSFDLAEIDSEGEVAAPAGWKTARQMSDELAASLDCKWIEDETLLVLTPNDARLAKAISNITDLEDFAGNKASAVATLMKFLQPAAEPPAKTFQIGPSRQEQQLASLATEALRRMRGIESKVPDWRLSRWAAAADSPALEWPLLTAGNTGPQIDTPISVAGFLLDIARRNDATCLVHWHDLTQRGIGPETLHFPPIKSDAASTLHDALSRWDIEVRKVDSQHWWIGSHATYDRLPMVVWTSKLGDRRERILERIQVVQVANPDADIRIAIDPLSDRALLKMPRYIARQLSKILPPP